MCAQRRLRSAWVSAQSDQSLHCALSEDSDQPGYPPSLIRVFTVRSKGSQGPKLSFCGQRRLADAQAELSHRWAHRLLVLSCCDSNIKIPPCFLNPLMVCINFQISCIASKICLFRIKTLYVFLIKCSAVVTNLFQQNEQISKVPRNPGFDLLIKLHKCYTDQAHSFTSQSPLLCTVYKV